MTDVRAGQIWQFGRHRLMCGDATSKDNVTKILAGEKPTLVVTSPPYAKQRNYDQAIPCWDSMMMASFCVQPFSDDVQMFVNLGVVHKKGELVPYHLNWLRLMREAGVKHAGTYVWDKLQPIPGRNDGVPRPAHEFIYHLRKRKVNINNTEINKHAGKMNWGAKYKTANGAIIPKNKQLISDRRPIDSVIRMYAEKNNRSGHPAVSPIALPAKLIKSYKKQNTLVYDPFCGSGTTMHAAEQEDVRCLGMEISAAYCGLAIARWDKAFPEQKAVLLNA